MRRGFWLAGWLAGCWPCCRHLNWELMCSIYDLHQDRQWTRLLGSWGCITAWDHGGPFHLSLRCPLFHQPP
jgi:hypothetical protein